LLLDRACPSGGWNFGNSVVFDSELPAYVPTTALALLSLQDYQETAALEPALKFIERHALAESSSMAFALAMLALTTLRRTEASSARRPAPSMSELSAALERQLSTTAEMGSVLGVAMGLYALKQTTEPDGAFRI
jgi:hypothetical protein